MGLQPYRKKRNFEKTPEPVGEISPAGSTPKFVVQEHHASHLHWDFRLEIGGVLKSWSVPKGPSLDPHVKRLAVEVEDHPVDDLTFAGTIPEGSYGAGVVRRWDIGTYEAVGDLVEGIKRGALKFRLQGKRLKGEWRFFKMKGRKQGDKPLWLLQKAADEHARTSHPASNRTRVRRVNIDKGSLRSGRSFPAAGGELQFARPGHSAEGKKGGKKTGNAVEAVPVVKPARIKRTPAPEGLSLTVDKFLSLKNPSGDVTVEIDGARVALTHLDRVYWPTERITKFELLCYYIRVFPFIDPFLRNRPAILQRYPRGIAAPKFFQHDLQSAPRYLRAARMRNEEGREIDYAVYTGLPTLLHLVNLGTIGQHPWHSTVDRIDLPDWLVIDLDPRGAPWENVLRAARVTRAVFEGWGLSVYPKTSGSSGIHLYLPLEPVYDYEAVALFAQVVANEAALRVPEIATVERAPSSRKKGQVYVDWLQNARGKSMAAPYSARAKRGATVSMPVTWEEIDKEARIADFTIRNLPKRLKAKGDRWNGFFEHRQRLPGRPEKRSKRVA